MKNSLLKHSLRKIKDNYKRFISLLFMSLLGVGFFVGIKATTNDMLKTLDQYYDNNNIYDIELVSNLGLTDYDIEKLEELDTIEKVTGSYIKDDYLKVTKREYVVRLMSIDEDINKLYLNSGRLPKTNNEIVVDSKLLRDNNIKINDNINIGEKDYKIVGEVISPIYYSMDRGMTNIGNGQIKYFAYVLKDEIKEDYYSTIFINVKDTKKYTTNDKNYNKKIEKTVKKIENIKEELEDNRFREVYKDIFKMTELLGTNYNWDSLEKAKIEINTRLDNQAYNDVIDASKNIEKLGNVFPLVFYVIAILISLITMMRMVEEDRLENGTMKALGYKTKEILIKYILFSLIATILGAIIGVFIGCNLIPRIIWNIYQMMFQVPNFICEINIKYTIIGLSIAIICICGSAIITCINNLNNVPATLMRPKSPKKGKRVLLERIPFIWNKFNFSQKITIRNIFRYKSRVAATIIGITGCTALILAGFGLRDAIRDIVTYQFERVFHYDRMIALKTNIDNDNLNTYLEENHNIDFYIPIYINDTEIEYNNKKTNANLVVSDNYKELDKVISLYAIKDKDKKITPKDDEVIISEKTKTVLGIDIGDNLSIIINNQVKNLKVSSIIENYVDQYIFMTSKTYNNLYGEYSNNTYYLKLNNDLTEDELNTLDEEILNIENVAGLVNSNEIIDLVRKTMNSLNSVVIVLIVSALLLAIVVLYNLSNINISERIREIATLKVLGFYNKEVDNYITKESIILSFIGIILGLFLGKYLSNFIISTCEPDTVMFVRNISIYSYIISALTTIVFTSIVNIITHFTLLKINMIESLKNVE